VGLEAVSSEGGRIVPRGRRAVSGALAATLLAAAGWLAPLVLDRDARRRLLAGEARAGAQVPTAGRLAAAAQELGADPRVRRAAVNGTELPYREAGNGPPVLLIHGGGGGWWVWDRLVDELAVDHRVIAYSRRGYTGAEQRATAWEQHRRDAAALLEHLDARGAVVVAWSGAGSVGPELALDRPDLVSGVVLLEPFVYPRRSLTPELVRVLVAILARRILLPDEQAIDPLYRRIAFARDDGTSRWAREDYPAVRRFGILGAAGAVYDDLRLVGLREPLSPAELARIGCPLTLLVGERTGVHLRRMAETVESIVPHTRRLQVRNADHDMPFNEPAATAEAIRSATRSAVGAS
jgi:pimeloyl-ACP methyl ester carboxylesterase